MISDSVSGKVVVVIDDAPLVLEGTARVLRNWGCRVVLATSCDATLAQLTKENQRPDLIISDYHLPDGKTGIDAIERLRNVFGTQIPAFLVSGDTAPQRLRHAQTNGYLLLHKPVDPMRLRATLNKLLDNPGRSSAKPTTTTAL
jgi:CheY-like chemotaxis protein